MLSEAQIQKLLDGLLEREGGLVDHPQDPGGLTKFGISSKSYPEVDIRNLTKDDAKAIYRRDYLEKFRLHELSQEWNAEIVLDWLVNGGSVKRIQRIVGVTPDGNIGPVTLRAIDKADPHYLLLQRLDYYLSLVPHPFLKGWVNRLKMLGL